MLCLGYGSWPSKGLVRALMGKVIGDATDESSARPSEDSAAAAPEEAASQDAAPNFFQLVILTQAVVTTIVGVCMVMKHDGMDMDGLTKWLFLNETFPYDLTPV